MAGRGARSGVARSLRAPTRGRSQRGTVPASTARMARDPDPATIFHRAAEEGDRRLGQSLLELTSTAFIAGFTIVFGIVALGIAHAAAEPQLGEMARLIGALAFAPGLVFLVIGRAELFTENFFDPTASLFARRRAASVPRLLRLWAITLAVNLITGGLFVLLLAVPEVLPDDAGRALATVAEEITTRGAWAAFVSAIIGGALVALLSYLLQAVEGGGSRIALSFLIGFLLAVGPFDHVVVTALHVLVGLFLDAQVSVADLVRVSLIATAGNLVGGVGLVTLSHAAQAKGAEHSDGDA